MSVASDYVQYWITAPEDRPKYQPEPEPEISSARPVDNIEDIPEVTYRMWIPPKTRIPVGVNGMAQHGSGAGFFKQAVTVNSYPVPSRSRATRASSRAVSANSRYRSMSFDREESVSDTSEGRHAKGSSSYSLRRKERSSLSLGLRKTALKRDSSVVINEEKCHSPRPLHTCARLAKSVPAIPCLWGDGCEAKVHVHGLCIKAHVEKMHLKNTPSSKSEMIVNCRWESHIPGRGCGEKIKWQSFPRHVEAEKHLGLSRNCPVCEDKIGDRTDAIKRHLKGGCKGCQAPGCTYRMSKREIAAIQPGLDPEEWNQHICPHPGRK
ncbi:hypothetical protein OE88DRAFT_1657415 [Heliocybe sulcata]|uniref:Uncharacterized protein n=1 Tax=Heliocybe sulcata TaxID=5364 RepID=A0A5C3N3E6_9AGAM|nr:hypothetical protein OE88DRAFT_1657415 [Heliocybe sulcata]